MSKIISGLMGLVVADAVGVPYEFKERGTFNATDMTGYGTYNMPVGTWSDDSSMTLATVDSLVMNKGKIDTYSIMNGFCEWFFGGLYTPYGNVFDVGNTTRIAIQRYETNRHFPYALKPEMSGGISITDNGNGSLMRILPLAFVECRDEEIANVSALTHAHEISKTACIIYITIAKNLLNGVLLEQAIEYGCKYTDKKEFNPLHDLKERKPDEIRSTGYVVDTLAAALWCLLNTNSYKECVLKAVNLGGDTDTIAAVAGGLAGILYADSDKGIPPEWIEQLAKKNEIISLFESFERVVNNGN